MGYGVGIGCGVVPRVAGGSAPWDPTQVTLRYWYDFSDGATITSDVNGISAVDDKGPNNWDFAQSDNGKKMSVASAAQNGLDGADCSSSVMDQVATRVVSGDMSLFIVMHPDAVALGSILAESGSDYLLLNSTGAISYLGSQIAGASSYSAAAQVLEIHRDASDNLECWIDGTEVTDGSPVSSANTGDLRHLGDRDATGTNRPFAGKLYEIFATASVLADPAPARSYLQNKWGL